MATSMATVREAWEAPIGEKYEVEWELDVGVGVAGDEGEGAWGCDWAEPEGRTTITHSPALMPVSFIRSVSASILPLYIHLPLNSGIRSFTAATVSSRVAVTALFASLPSLRLNVNDIKKGKLFKANENNKANSLARART